MKSTLSKRNHFALGALLFCAALPAAAEIASATAQREGDRILLHWRSAQPVDVYEAERADAPPARRKLISKADADGQHSAAVAAARRFYFLQAKDDAHWTAERLLPLEGGTNFRDLGGYATTDGHHVKWGEFYRSGAMNHLTPKDYEYLSSLDIKVVCDLRSRQEREISPTKWQAKPAARYTAVDYDGDAMFRRILPTNAKQPRTDFYDEAPEIFAPQYRAMFRSLLAGEAPLAVNCSAGQDRTGIASGLILTALGVPRETIYQDYHLSTQLRRPENETPSVDLNEYKDRNAVARFHWERQQMLKEGKDPFKPTPLINADGQPKLAVAFKAMETRYGSVEGYLQKQLGVGPAEIAKLRTMYLD